MILKSIHLRIRVIYKLAWWRTPLIPALRSQRQANFWVQGQPDLQSEFQNSQGYTKKPCLEKPQKKKKKKKKKERKKTITYKVLFFKIDTVIINIEQSLKSHSLLFSYNLGLFLKNVLNKLGMVTHTCNPSTWDRGSLRPVRWGYMIPCLTKMSNESQTDGKVLNTIAPLPNF